MAIEAASEQARPHPRSPGTTVPAGACDTHAHMFAPAGIDPYAEKRPCRAPGAALAADRSMLQALRIERAGHSNVYGPGQRDDRRLVEMAGWQGSPTAAPGLRQVLVENPARLYGFAAP